MIDRRHIDIFSYLLQILYLASISTTRNSYARRTSICDFNQLQKGLDFYYNHETTDYRWSI